MTKVMNRYEMQRARIDLVFPVLGLATWTKAGKNLLNQSRGCRQMKPESQRMQCRVEMVRGIAEARLVSTHMAVLKSRIESSREGPEARVRGWMRRSTSREGAAEEEPVVVCLRR